MYILNMFNKLFIYEYFPTHGNTLLSFQSPNQVKTIVSQTITDQLRLKAASVN